MDLYQIKSLEWESLEGVWLAGRYVINKYAESCFELQCDQLRVSGHKALEEAKEACEEHRRKELLEDTLESAYRPTTQLPKEPGLYWWRKFNRPKENWMVVHLLPSGKLVPSWHNLRIDRVTPEDWEAHYGPDQWIHIPEPLL